jgi:hypothetical protein
LKEEEGTFSWFDWLGYNKDSGLKCGKQGQKQKGIMAKEL